MPNTSVVLKHGRYQLTFRVWAIKLICHLSSNRTPIARRFEQHLNCLPKETGSLKISIKFRRFQVRSRAGTNFFFSFLPCPSRRCVWRVPRLQGRGWDQDCLPIRKIGNVRIEPRQNSREKARRKGRTRQHSLENSAQPARPESRWVVSSHPRVSGDFRPFVLVRPSGTLGWPSQANRSFGVCERRW